MATMCDEKVPRTSHCIMPGFGTELKMLDHLFAVQTVCLAFAMPLTIGLVMLLAWNLYLALQNKTTIEFHEGVTANIKVCPHTPRFDPFVSVLMTQTHKSY